ncbi:hypothetical protein SAMN04488128_105385 [Chitinophaga eiseniae]|uniref:Uncharacterized protein n=1 Tax=Chitinophaga eiseniae TaxID=634771 RepID=A0A1T4TLC3_9BACT|nr:hypothetical protein SAMN04488128_105385 [Chitinophaga eiseniae]
MTIVWAFKLTEKFNNGRTHKVNELKKDTLKVKLFYVSFFGIKLKS